MKNFRVENLRHEAHAMVLEKFPLVAGDDPGAFLAAMLQRVEAVVGELGSIGMSKNAEHAAIMFGVILHHLLAPAAELSQRRAGGAIQIEDVVSALCADSFEPPACAMLRRGKQARRYNKSGRTIWRFL
jgi:hypothetical protein